MKSSSICLRFPTHVNMWKSGFLSSLMPHKIKRIVPNASSINAAVRVIHPSKVFGAVYPR